MSEGGRLAGEWSVLDDQELGASQDFADPGR